MVSIVAPAEFLAPNTTYSIHGRAKASEPLTILSTFNTGNGYDKDAGTAPVLESFKLWRVRYPVEEINSGNCVFSEYVGFAEVKWKPGTIPNTPPSSLVHTLRLRSKTGGESKPFFVIGDSNSLGAEPEEEHPFPFADWNPELDPTQEYCLSIQTQGDGDLARLPIEGNQLCACVEQRSAAKAPPAPFDNGCGTGTNGAAGTSSEGTAGTSASAGSSGAGSSGDSSNNSSGRGGSSNESAPDADSSGGCQLVTGSSGGWFGAALMAGSAALLRRRRRAHSPR